MKPFIQAVRVARRLMSEGRIGSDLANGIHPVVSVLSPEEKRRLAKRISREYLILGHAAHDPNMYKTCQAAKEAKENSKNSHLKILTYKTPMCGSCGLNRNATCGLMGGLLIDGPGAIPEKAVHKTADIMIANRDLDEGEARLVEMGRESSTNRVATLHDRRIKANTYVDDNYAKAQMDSRRAASILEPGESFDAKPKALIGPSRAVNAEVLGLGGVDDEEDPGLEASVDQMGSMFDDTMTIDIPEDLPRNKSASLLMDSYTETDVPRRERRQASLDQEDYNEAQESLFRLAKVASKILAEGAMTTRRASQIYQSMQTLLDNGARHTRKTARLERQIDSLGGGMQM